MKKAIFLLIIGTLFSSFFVNGFSFNESHRYSFNESCRDSVGTVDLTETAVLYNSSIKEGNGSLVLDGQTNGAGTSYCRTTAMDTDWGNLTVNCWANISNKPNVGQDVYVYSQKVQTPGAHFYMLIYSDSETTLQMGAHMPIDVQSMSSPTLSSNLINKSHMYTWIVSQGGKSYFFIDGIEQNKSTDATASTGTLQGFAAFGCVQRCRYCCHWHERRNRFRACRDACL